MKRQLVLTLLTVLALVSAGCPPKEDKHDNHQHKPGEAHDNEKEHQKR